MLNIKVPAYCSLGFFLSQLFHFFIFYNQKSDTIMGFPHYNLPMRYALNASFLLLFVSFMILLLGYNRFSDCPSIFIVLVIFPLILSQIFGRSLIKFGFEASFCLIVFLSLLLEKYYGNTLIDSVEVEKIKFLYTELWEILKISVTVCVFWLGTVGVTFAVQFLNRYFEKSPSMTQYQMFRYGVMFVYSIFGTAIFFYYPLFSKIAYLRNILLKH